MRITKTSLLLCAATGAALAGASPAWAQDASAADAANDDIGEIIVTAQFREQRLQDTPIAITAIDGDGLAARSYTTVTDLTNSAPNVVLKPTSSAFGPGAAVFIRGVGQADTNFAYEPGVGLYVDDVYHGTVFGSQLDLLDLDRVEILRGPQGTLAGKNSIGGAVKLYTKKPTGEGGFLEGTIGSRDQIDLRGSGDFTLVPDRLFMRLSGVTRHQQGYVTRYDFGCRNPGVAGVPATGSPKEDCVIGHEGGKDYTAGRLALRWVASDNVEVNISASKLVDDSEPAATTLLALTVAPTLTPGFTDRALLIPAKGEYYNYSTYVTPAFTDADGSHPATVWDPNTRLRAWEVAGTVDWTISDTLALKSITAYQDLSGSYGSDYDVTPFGINTSNITNSHHQFTQELRLNGTSFADKLDWTLGAYYYDATSYIEGGDIIAPGLATSSVFYSDDTIPAESISGFAHAVIHVTDRLNLTGGIRYTHDKKDYHFRRLNVFDTSEPSYTAQNKIDGAVGKYSGDRWDYRINADYELTPDLMVYAQFSTGYRGGGVNPRPFVIQQVQSFEPESLNAYEIGFKSDFLNRAVRLNMSAFVNDYKDIIFSNTAPTVVDGVTISAQNATPTNAGDARFTGVEAELTLRPFKGFTIDATGSYLDFQLKSIGASGATISGITLDSQAPYITKWKGSLGVQYAADLGSAGTLTPRFDLAYQSSFFTASDNNPATLVPAYTVMNARLAWTSPDEDWQVALAVTNLADEFYYRNKNRLPIGIVSGQPGAPREWSLSVRRNF
ncbi:TonB-dependent receptor [Altererythrobacter fulvus]|uniref:TonB-dependent receptor n=1 Tax=Caenibius fulvus TaxID=2126012 RepID=UPI003016B4A9